VARQLDADLIVSIAEVVRTSRGVEVINLIEAAVAREEQETFLGDQVIGLKPAELYVQPRSILQVIETDKGAFKVKDPRRIG
jgi:hypothetical protein